MGTFSPQKYEGSMTCHYRFQEFHVDIATSKTDSGRISAGSVHHIAWRAATAETQLTWRNNLSLAGQDVTSVIDRKYFQSIYYRDPGGILYEVATDLPGLGVDE
jgi:glyoxalase family protein